MSDFPYWPMVIQGLQMLVGVALSYYTLQWVDGTWR